MDELTNRVFDHGGLVGDLFEIETRRHSGHEIGGGAADGGTELKNIGALRHHNPDADGRLVFLPDEKIRWIHKAVAHCRNVAQAKHAAVGLHRCLGDGFGAVESACDAQGYALRSGLHGAGRHHRVLSGQ